MQYESKRPQKARNAWLRFIAFPGLWLAMLAVVCFANVSPEIGVPLVVLVGIVAGVWAVLSWTAFASKAVKVSICVALAAIIAISSAYMVAAFRWLTWDPIGDSSDNGIGFDLFEPKVEDLGTIEGSGGSVAVVRRETPFLDIAGATYYVFVKPAADAPSRANLAFRYTTTTYAIDAKPTLNWTGPRSLELSLPSGVVHQITMKRDEVAGVSIQYEVGSSECPPIEHPWQRSFFGDNPC